MKYLCLAYYDEKKFETLTEAEMAAIGRDCGPLDEDLRRSGHLLEVGSLAATKDSVSLRPRNGKVTVTDGPFIEVKDLVAGFIVVEARDLAQAAELANGCPILEGGGSVEVRPVRQFTP